MKNKSVLITFPGLRVKNDDGAKHRLNSFINEYSKAGYDVYVLPFVKGPMVGVNDFLNKNARWFLFPMILPIARNGLITRALFQYFEFILTIFTWFLNPDIVQMEGLAINGRLCRKKCLYYVDFHGDAVYEYVETGRGTIDGWFAKFMLKRQKKSIKFSDKVIAVTEKLIKQLELNTNEQIKNYSIISCGVDLSRFDVGCASLDIDISNRIVLGYCGGLQKWQNIEIILDMVIRLRALNDKVFFCLFTNSDTTQIQDRLSLIGEKNYYIKALKTEDVPSHLKILDAGFLIRDNFILNKVSSPTKISEYLAAGARLICTAYSGDYEAYVTNSDDSVFIIDSNKESDIPKLMDWLVRNGKRRLDNSFLKGMTFGEQFRKAGLTV